MSRIEGAPRAQPQPQPNAKGEVAPGGTSPVVPGQAGVVANAPGTLSVPAGAVIADGMSEGMPATTPQATVVEAGLRAGTAANPFQGLVAQRGVAGADVLRLAELGISVDVDLAPDDTQLGKLAGFEKHSVHPKGRFAAHQRALLQTGSKVREGFMLNLSDSLPTDTADSEPLAQTRSHVAGVIAAEAGTQRAQAAVANTMSAQRASFPMGMDVHSFVQAVLREAYLFQSDELKEKGERLKALNDHRRALRKKQRRAQELKFIVLSGSPTVDDLQELSELLGFQVADPDSDVMPTAADTGAADQIDGEADPASSPDPTIDAGSSRQTTSGLSASSPNPGGLSDAATRMVEGVLSRPRALEAPALHGELTHELSSRQNDNHVDIVKYVDRNGTHALQDLVKSAHLMEPEEFRQLLRGLLNIAHWVERDILDFYDDRMNMNNSDARKYRDVANDLKPELGEIIQDLVGHASPAQILYLDSEGIDVGGIDSFVEFSGVVRTARQISESTSDPDLQLLESLYSALKSGAGTAHTLGYQLHHSSPETVHAFLEKYGAEYHAANEYGFQSWIKHLNPNFLQDDANLERMASWMNDIYAFNENELNRTASTFVDGVTFEIPDDPSPGLERLTNALATNADAIIGEAPADVVEFMTTLIENDMLSTLQAGSSLLSSEDFSLLSSFLVTASEHTDALPEGTEGLISSALDTLVTNATPGQLLGLSPDDAETSKLIGLTSVSFTNRRAAAESYADQLTDEDDTPLTGVDYQLRDLFLALEGKRPVEQQRVLNQLKSVLFAAEIDEVARFFDFAGPTMAARGETAFLTELLGATKRMFFEGDTISRFAWLNDLPEGTAAQRWSTVDDPSSVGMGQTQTSGESSTGVDGAGMPADGTESGLTSRPQLADNTYYHNLMSDEEKEEFFKLKLDTLEDEIANQGEDAQLMQLELQDQLQKQQQLMTMMTNISKMLHDVAMSIIRNIGG